MAQAAAAAPPADDLVPVQLALNGTREGAVQEWVLWPPSATEADLSDFTDSLVRDLGLQVRRWQLLLCTAAWGSRRHGHCGDSVARVPAPTLTCTCSVPYSLLQPQLKQPVTEAIAAQVTDWCTSVPPPARGPAPCRELIRCEGDAVCELPAARAVVG